MLQQDPAGIAAGLNLYQYAGNNPASFTDPFGLCKDPNDWACALFESGMTALGGTLGFAVGAAAAGGEELVSFGVLTPVAAATIAGSTAAGIAGGKALGQLLSNAMFSQGSSGSGSSDGAAKAGANFARKNHLSPNNPAVPNRGMRVQEFISKFRQASVSREMPGEFMDQTVEDALRSGNQTVRKLLTDGRWAK